MSSTLKDRIIKHVLLPNRVVVQRTRGLLNKEIHDYIGEFVHIEVTHHGCKGMTMYNPWNNIFVDIK